MTEVGLATNESSTGVVQVSFVDGEPSYEIVPDRAYDHLDFQPRLPAEHEISVIYHGSLAWRSPTSRAAILEYRDALPSCPVIVDLNIRKPWFELGWLKELMSGVHTLKLSADELGEVVAGFTPAALTDPAVKLLSIRVAADELIRAFDLKRVWVTDGSDGAYLVDPSADPVFLPAQPIGQLEDTIGAGDAFTAAAIDGWIRGDDGRDILRHAMQFAAKVCTLKGATTDDSNFYQN